jgi:hypothetical protein
MIDMLGLHIPRFDIHPVIVSSLCNLRPSSLPPLEMVEEENNALLHLPSLPSQPLLALPGADVDDSLLLPAVDWDMDNLLYLSYSPLSTAPKG